MNNKNSDEQIFYQRYPYVSKYFKEGLLEELYSDDSYSICKFANYSYVVMPKRYIENYKPIFLWATEELIRNLVKYGDKLLNKQLEYISEMPERKAQEQFFVLSEENLDYARKGKKAQDLKGPSPYLNSNFEMELRQLNEEKKMNDNGKRI